MRYADCVGFKIIEEAALPGSLFVFPGPSRQRLTYGGKRRELPYSVPSAICPPGESIITTTGRTTPYGV